MAKKSQKTNLHLVTSATSQSSTPPRTLGQHGQALYDRILSEYEISDAGGLQLLLLAAEATDRLQALRANIDQDGEVLRTRSGPKPHPALRTELSTRSFIVRTLARLGLDVTDPLAQPGHPLTGVKKYWSPDDGG
jgi:hypothetical protein